MTTHNPYDNRLAVANPCEFHDRIKSCGNILKRICAPSGQSCAIVGETRIGKSSLLRYLAHPEGATASPCLRRHVGVPSDYLFVLVDLQTLPVRNPLALWRHIFARVSEEATRQSTKPSNPGAYTFARATHSNDDYEVQVLLEEYLHHLRQKVILLFDDFEVVVESFSKADAARSTGKLRALAQGDLSLLIASTDPLPVLFHRAGLDREPSPLHNMLFTEPLGLLEAEGAGALIREPAHNLPATPVEFSHQDVKFLMRVAGRHPDLLKVSCYHLFNAKSQGEVEYEQVAITIERDPHVRWLMNRLWARVSEAQECEGIPLLEALVSVAQGAQPADSLALLELRNRGLVDTSDGSSHIFSDLFRQRILEERKGARRPDAPAGQPAIRIEPLDRKGQTKEYERLCAGTPEQDIVQGIGVQLQQMDTKLTAIQSAINDLREDLLTLFDENDRTIISAVFERLDQQQMATVGAVLEGIEANRVTEKDSRETVAALKRALSEIQEKGITVLADSHASQAQKVFAAPGLDVKHKLKVAVPIIPLILSYEAEFELNSGMDLEQAWDRLLKKIPGRCGSGTSKK